jgi:hypothetical protein
VTVAVTCPACGVKATDLPADHEMAVGVAPSGWPVMICTDGVMTTAPAGYRVQ